MDASTVLSNMRVTINQYRSMFGENPVGTNPEITRALNGDNPKQARFIKEELGLRINGGGNSVLLPSALRHRDGDSLRWSR
jgi:hypothetical protein